MTHDLDPLFDRLERTTLIVLVSANVLMPLLLTYRGWPKPWRAFDGEESWINWYSVCQCTAIAVLAFVIWGVTVLGRRLGTERVSRAWPWLIFAAGFMAMSADEGLQGHEQIREKFLVPHGWFTDLKIFIPGDVVLMFYVLVGLGLSWFLLAELRRDRASLIAFGVAICLVGIAAFQDALDIEFVRRRSFRHFQTIAEELAEIWSQMLFAGAFVRLLFQKLRLLFGGNVAGQAGSGSA